MQFLTWSPEKRLPLDVPMVFGTDLEKLLVSKMHIQGVWWRSHKERAHSVLILYLKQTHRRAASVRRRFEDAAQPLHQGE
eukprot:4845121-Amphidinium_carterae.1